MHGKGRCKGTSLPKESEAWTLAVVEVAGLGKTRLRLQSLEVSWESRVAGKVTLFGPRVADLEADVDIADGHLQPVEHQGRQVRQEGPRKAAALRRGRGASGASAAGPGEPHQVPRRQLSLHACWVRACLCGESCMTRG